MRRPFRCLLVLALSVVSLGAAGCGSSTSSSGGTTNLAPSTTAASTTTAPPATTTTVPKVTGDITVLAAASLTDAFKELGTAFQTVNPGAKVTFSFGSSSTLVTQINQGAPADVFASADTANMDKLTVAGAAGITGTASTFATNKLQIIVGKGNPLAITGVDDLTKARLIYVTAAPEVPIGKYALQVLTNAKVTVTPKSLEADVKSIVNKVTLGEADAGIVYATDVIAAGDKAVGVTIPDDLNVLATYPIAVTKAATNAPAATAFVAFVAGAEGQRILAKFGFDKP